MNLAVGPEESQQGLDSNFKWKVFQSEVKGVVTINTFFTKEAC